MGWNNISSVEPTLLADALNKLETVGLSGTSLTIEQAEALFTAISGGTQLKCLDIAENNLDMVEPTLLATAVRKLETVDLSLPWSTYYPTNDIKEGNHTSLLSRTCDCPPRGKPRRRAA